MFTRFWCFANIPEIYNFCPGIETIHFAKYKVKISNVGHSPVEYIVQTIREFYCRLEPVMSEVVTGGLLHVFKERSEKRGTIKQLAAYKNKKWKF